MTVPTDPRLPGGGGNQLTYYNVNPNKFGQTQNYNTLSDKYGDEYEHWNGVDVSVSGRLQNGLRFQAGTSTGHTVADNCAVIAQVPEMLTNGPTNAAGTAAAAGPATGAGVLPPRRTVADQLQGPRRSTRFPKRMCSSRSRSAACPASRTPTATAPAARSRRAWPANFVATNAYLAANSNLGRLLSGTTTATQNTTLQIINPDTRVSRSRQPARFPRRQGVPVSRHAARRSTSISTT